MDKTDAKVTERLDALESALKNGDFDKAGDLVSQLGCDVARMSDDDRDWYNAAKIGVKERDWASAYGAAGVR